MFTGIIETVGKLKWKKPSSSGLRICVEFSPGAEPVKGGESVAINGVCLTVCGMARDSFEFDVSRQTASATTIQSLALGTRLNIERAMKPDFRLGGHLVMGHVDGVGIVKEFRKDGSAAHMLVAMDPAIARINVPRGSIAIDGVSLTIAEADSASVRLVLIPETLARTALGGLSEGSGVNVETDIIGKYVFRRIDLANPGARGKSAGMSEGMLREQGYL